MNASLMMKVTPQAAPQQQQAALSTPPCLVTRFCVCGGACACGVRVRVRCRCSFGFENAALANQVLGPTASYMDQARHLDVQLDTMQRIDVPQGYANTNSHFRVWLPACYLPHYTRH